jgi:ketosteroid isomerase-like protein
MSRKLSDAARLGLLIGTLLSPTGLSARNVDAGGSGDPALVRAEQGWMAAMQRRDADALERYLDSAFTLSGLDPIERPPVPRATWIDNTLHHLTLTLFHFEALRAQTTGRVGVVRARFRCAGRFDGDPAFDSSGTVIDTWVRQGRRWRVVSRVVGAEADTPPATPR